mmetsp:Transcript_21310/g.46250  ORF Transcript_21310/g.46250 Transcript_21310/m.46250 type:complete len:251 (+) Transcript_21310:345-1097(+)
MNTLGQLELREYRRSHGMSKSIRVEREGIAEAPHPRRGGSRGYPHSERIRMLDMWKKGMPVPKDMLSSIRRWAKRPVPFEMTGGVKSSSMTGHHRFLLAIFKKIYPQASRKECAAFVAVHSVNNQVFTDMDISRALKDMNMTRKKASTTAYQAFTPKNLHLHFRFWTYSFPAGIIGVRRKDLLDVDEMALQLEDANVNYGHAVRNCRVRKIGNYGRGKKKITIIMAIEAGDPDPRLANQMGSTDLRETTY